MAAPRPTRTVPDHNQFIVPRSFIDLFVPAGRQRPNEPREWIAERYELCEDLAQMLTETARARLGDLGIAEDDVLVRIQRGLLEGELVTPAEVGWVVQRLAELLDWPWHGPLSDA